MNVLTVAPPGHPEGVGRSAREILQSSSHWETIDGKHEITQVQLEAMYELMVQENGIGLAAPQIGLNRRFFVLHESIYAPRFVLNPKIIDVSDSSWGIEECLSFPGRRFMVNRPSFVVWTDEYEGRDYQHRDLRGYLARVFLHEYDHLDGITMLDQREIF